MAGLLRADELGLKLLSAESDIAARFARAGQLSSQQWRDLYVAARRVAGARLDLDDTTGLVLRDLEARAWWLKTQHPDLALLVVDYLQLVTAGVKVEQRPPEVALITRRLKELAGQLAVPVLVLSQLNRELTRRSDPRPQLADLAESGAIRPAPSSSPGPAPRPRSATARPRPALPQGRPRPPPRRHPLSGYLEGRERTTMTCTIERYRNVR